MDPLRLSTALIGLLQSYVQVTAYLVNSTSSVFLSSPTEKALRESIGTFRLLVLKWFLPDTLEQLERRDQSVLPGSDEVVLAFKNSYTSDCTQTAVAVGSLSLGIRLSRSMFN